MAGVDEAAPPPTTSVFLGEVSTDLVLRGTPGVPGRRFARMCLDGEHWADYVEARCAGFQASAHPGGSAANVAAAFVAAMPRSHRTHVVCAAAAVPARARPPLWWPGYSPSAADLAARGVRVWGHQVAAQTPDTPGAVVLVDPDGRVAELVANAGPTRAPTLPAGDLLVARSDHLHLVDRGYLPGVAYLGILLADDQLGWDVAAQVVARVDRAWVFGGVGDTEAFEAGLGAPLPAGVTLVGTNGAGDCVVRRAGQQQLALPVTARPVATLPVTALPVATLPGAARIGTDLGAGDAYMGGFLSQAVRGTGPAQAHQHGCAAAAAVLRCVGARPEPEADLNHVVAGIDRASDRTDEGRLFFTVRRSPGLTVVTGGQTGVDTVAAQSAGDAGLPVHLVLPAGRRREDGPLTGAQPLQLHRARTHELGSASFRYRTWATVYLADAVILLDRAGGEGSAATRRAAEQLHRPLLDLRDRVPQPREVAAWVRDSNARVVLVAGSRASLLERAGVAEEDLTRQVDALVEGLCAANATLLRAATDTAATAGGSAGGPRASLRHAMGTGGHRRVGVPQRLLDWLGTSAFAGADLVVLSPRDLATAFARRELDAVLTWPSLLPTEALRHAQLLPLGCFTVHYGFLQRAATVPPAPRVAVQYQQAWRECGHRWAAGAFGIEGSAEVWLAAGLADIAYDSWRTGASAASFGLAEFYPTHWDSASLIWRHASMPEGKT